MPTTPKESTSRAALAAASALLDLCEAATGKSNRLTADDCVNRSVVIAGNVKQLRPHQLDELTMFIAERLGVFGAEETGTDPDPRWDIPSRDARQEAAVDELVELVDPREAADRLAERVRGGTDA